MSIPKLLRVAVGVAALVPFATCTDFTGPTKPGVRVPIAPTFSKSATFAKAVYAAAGIEFNQVRVLIVRNEIEVLKDTTVAFSPSSADLTLPLLVTATPGEVVSVTLEYRNADIILYSGTQSVTTVATGETSTTPPTPLVLVPVGPGSSAATVQLSPASGTFSTAAPVPFSATAFASDNTPIANAIFGWEVSDVTIATVNGQGVVQPTSKGGVAKVTATTLNGKFAEASITFVTPPASLAIHSGGGQSAMALDALAAPVVVKVLDANGAAVPGATVNFAVATGGGSLVVLNGVSNASGLVSVNWTLGETVGNQSITATAAALPNSPITINATATERPAKNLVIGQQPLKSLMGASITPAVTVKAFDDKGHIVAGYTGAITIALDANPTGATLGGTLTVNAVAGVATFSTLTINKAGEGYTLKATAVNLTAAVTDAFGVDQVPSGLSLNAGGNQTKAIKSVLDQIIVKVADANGIGVAGVTVTFEVVSGGGSIVVNNGTTDAGGLARVTWTLGTVIGEQSIKATAGALNGSPLTIKATGTALPAIALAFEVQPSTAAVGAAIAPAVKVKAIDEDGGIVTGFAGDIALTLENANGATLSGTTSVAAVNGVATFSNLSVNLVGSGYKLNATSGSFTATLSSAFTITPGAPTALAFLVQPSNVIAGVAISPPIQVKIVDANGNIVDVAASVTLARDNPLLDISLAGTLTKTAVNGIATFDDITMGPAMSGVRLKATSSGLTAVTSNQFDVTPVPGVSKTWTGALSTNWADAGNWSPSGIPAEQDSVTIVTAPNQPVIQGPAYTKHLVVETGASLQVNYSASLIMADKVVNKGTLVLTSAYFIGDIENHDTVLADSIAFANSFANIGPTSKLSVKASRGTSYAYLDIATFLTNEGEIRLEDTNGQDAYLSAYDSLLNKSTGIINVVQGSGGGRTLQTTLINKGALNATTTDGLYLSDPNENRISSNEGTMTFTGATPFYHYFVDSTLVFKNLGTIAMGTAVWEVLEGTYELKTGTVTGSGKFSSYYAKLDIDWLKFPLTLQMNFGTRFPGDSLYIPAGQTAKLTESSVDQKVVIRGTLRILQSGGGTTSLTRKLSMYSTGVLDVQDFLSVDSAFAIPAGGKLTLNANTQNIEVEFNQPLTNSGTVEMTSTGGAYVPSLHTPTFTNASGGTLTALGGSGGERDIWATLNNQAGGIITVAATSYINLIRGGATHTNAGTITMADASPPGAAPANYNLYSFTLQTYETASTFANSGTINIGANRQLYLQSLNSITNTGVIAGKGSIDQTSISTSFTNAGTIKPGGAGVVGTMLYKGAFNIGTGTVEIDVASMVSGDQMQATLSATLGKVKVVELAGFQAGAGNIKAISAGPNGFTCSGTLSIEPAGVWSGYNDGCVYVYPIILFGPPKPPVH